MRLNEGTGDWPTVTVVTIGHSVRDELDGCFASIREHASLPVQTILVDNASTDGTVQWVHEAYPEVEVIELDQNVFGSARNVGLEHVRSPHTMFIDSDARLTAGALPAMVAALDGHPEWGMIAPQLIYPDGTLQLSCRRFPHWLMPVMRRPPLNRVLERSRTVSRHLMRDIDHSRSRPILYAIGACLLFRTQVARVIGPLDARLSWGGEDVDWCVRFWRAGAEVHYLPEATVIHAYRRTSSKRPLSVDAWRHLMAFTWLQIKYRRQRRELQRLSEALDSRASFGAIPW